MVAETGPRAPAAENEAPKRRLFARRSGQNATKAVSLFPADLLPSPPGLPRTFTSRLIAEKHTADKAMKTRPMTPPQRFEPAALPSSSSSPVVGAARPGAGLSSSSSSGTVVYSLVLGMLSLLNGCNMRSFTSPLPMFPQGARNSALWC